MKRKPKRDIKTILSKSWAAGATRVKIDGIEYFRDADPKPKASAMEQDPKPFPIPDGMSDEEVLYWSCGYYDQMQADKQQREEQLKIERSLRGQA